MKDFSDMKYHDLSEQIVQVLLNKTQSSDPLFFRVLVAYYLTKIVGTMRPVIQTLDRGRIPINLYAINLAPSGFSKGYSTNLIENQVIHKFKAAFMQQTFPIIGEASLGRIALERAARNGTDPTDERKTVDSEFTRSGPFLFSFSEGTSPAVKQMRHKLIMADCGAVNLEMDELGSNLIANTDVLNAFLELYDVGRIKEKLIKNTADNMRTESIDGVTPTNMMLYGTPTKLLDGSKTEDEFMSFLSTGFARRCLFGFVKSSVSNIQALTPAEILKLRTDKTNDTFLDGVATQLEVLAQPQNHGRAVLVDEPMTLAIIEYEQYCGLRVAQMPELDDIRRSEMTHRYFKALKLAGAYAFIEGSTYLKAHHLEAAIKLVEDSGVALHELLKRDKPHVKLAKFLADAETDLTHADLLEDVPSFKGTIAAKNEQITLATAWGYKNNIVIKKYFVEGIEFLSADSLKETNLDEIIFSHSTDIAYNYVNHHLPFDQLHKLTQADGWHWCAQHLRNGHRTNDSIIEGFNMVVIDVDEGVSLDTAKLLLAGHKCMFYTTKRHTDADNRFRIIFPTNYILKLDTDDYKEFMGNIYDWLPFKVDTSTSDRPRKWMSHDGTYEYLDGELLDVLPFIPKTVKAEEQRKAIVDMENMDNLERWFMQKTGKGNRSNQLIKYALMLVDGGAEYDFIEKAILTLNDKLATPVETVEIYATVLRTVSSRISKRP
jgi:hypothetical protein